MGFKEKKGDRTIVKIVMQYQLIVFALLVWGCASTDVGEVTQGVLVPLETVSPPPVGVDAEKAFPRAGDAELASLLKEQGITGVGLEFESPEVVGLLKEVFAAPLTRERRIRSVYTGGRLEYDLKSESLTIGGTKDSKKILEFISKIPKRVK